jgi:endonuclease YncB( thermonuclease family)
MYLPLLLLFALFVSEPLQSQGRPTPASLRGTVVAIHDGDTISIRTTTETVRVRLYGVDCPEYKQPFSQRARQLTSRLTFKKSVTVRVEGRDLYDRIIGRVVVDGLDVNEALVRAGLAWHHETGAGDRRLAEAEKAARAERAGLWAEKDPIPPWRWRRYVGA